MLKKFEKYDFILVLILVLGALFLFQQYSFKKEIPLRTQSVKVVVRAESSEDISEDTLKNLNVAYFSNSSKASKIEGIERKGNTLFVTISDLGEKSDTKAIFAGQHVSLNDRVKIHGLIELEGVVVEITGEEK